MKFEVMIIFVLIIIIGLIILFGRKKNSPDISTSAIPASILKSRKDQENKLNSQKNVKFQDIRKSALSNDIKTTNDQTPTNELMNMYQPARETVPSDEVPMFHNGRNQFEPMRFNI